MLFGLDLYPLRRFLYGNDVILTILGINFILPVYANPSSIDGSDFVLQQAEQVQKEVDNLVATDKDIAAVASIHSPKLKQSSKLPESMKDQLQVIQDEAHKLIKKGDLPEQMSNKGGCSSQFFGQHNTTSSNCHKETQKRSEHAHEPGNSKNQEQILVFVSFSMPEASLKNLAQEAQIHNAVLVMQGLYEDSFAKTAKKLKTMEIGIEINPELFVQHKVSSVPTFINLKNGKPLSVIKGNVSLDFARRKFAEHRDGGAP